MARSTMMLASGAQGGAGFVATVPSGWRQLLPPTPSTVDARQPVSEVLADLLHHELPTSPRVVATLAELLHDDLPTIRETVAVLTPAQRRGHRALPARLPLVAPIVNEFEGLSLSRDEREVLLVAALCTDDQVDVLASSTEPASAVLAEGALGRHLVFARGRFRFADARMRVWAQETSSASERARAHRVLERVHRARGERAHADWHHARAALRRTPRVAPGLTVVARELLEAGHPEWGYHLAVEAADHAEGEQRGEAALVAGAAAIGAGWVEDAADWLGSLFPSGRPEHRAQALASLVIAETHVRGIVPALNRTEHRPQTDDRELWRAWARVAGLAAALCAERDDRSEMRAWLGELRAADAKAGADGTIRDPAVALCWLLSGEEETEDSAAGGALFRGMNDALRIAVAGDVDAALRILRRADTSIAEQAEPLVAGFERTPIADAYRAVIEVLLMFWRGDVALARDRLLQASVDLPIVLPFAGLGVVLARRLDLAVLGTPGALSRTLTAVLPSGTRIDQLVDRGIEAYLAGALEEGATSIRLWIDRGAPTTSLAVPGLDEVGPVHLARLIEPPELGLTRALARRIRQATDREWAREYQDVAAQSKQLRSPFNRARVESLLGSGCILRGDLVAGRRHLRAAQSLFADAGADGWRAAVDVRLARLGERREADARVDTVPITVIDSEDPLAACRVAWEPLLTDRELEVAMFVVDGASNRTVADRLGVSVRTVEVHMGRILGKLGVRSRVELTVLAHRTGNQL